MLLLLPSPSLAQSQTVDGRWDLRVACSAHVSNGRPGFEWTARVAVKDGQFVHLRSANDRNPYEESWNGQFSSRGRMAHVRLSATGSRPNGARWEFRFSPADMQRSEVELSGGVHARERGEEARVRTCTASLTRAEEPVVSQAPPVASTPSPSPKPAAAAPVVRQAVAQATTTLNEVLQKPAQEPGKTSAPSPSAPAARAPASSNAAAPLRETPPAPPRPSAVSPTPIPTSVRPTVHTQSTETQTAAGGHAAPAAATQAPPVNSPPTSASRSTPRSAAEVRKALYDDPGFDLALVVPLPGSGNLKRTLDGKWTIGSGSVSVGTMGVLASDQSYDLKGFAALAPAERNTTLYAAPFYRASLYHPHPVPGAEKARGFSGKTPTVSAGISPNPAVRTNSQGTDDLKPEYALKVALGQAVGLALSTAIGKPVSHSLVYQSTANIVLVPRHKIDAAYNPPLTQGHWAARIHNGEAVVLGYITQAQIRQGLTTHRNATTAANKQEADLLTTLRDSPESGPESLIGAITVRTGVNVKPCALKSELDWTPYLLKHEPIGAWITDRAPKWSHERPQGFDSADALFDELKSGRRCTAVFGRGPMIAKLAAALDRDRVGNLVYPQPQPQKVVLGLKAQALGFEDLAALEFAESIGTRDPQQIKTLQKLGASTKPLVDQARERLKKYDAQATTRLEVLIALMQDEAEARKQGISIEKLQSARAAREEKEAKAAAAAQAANDKRMAKDYPYVAQLRCRIGTQTINLITCLTDGGVDTEIELRNGSDYRMYKFHEAQSLGNWSNDGVAINLRPAFAIKAQNASSNAVLDLVILDRASGKVKFQKSAAKFGVVAVQN